MVLAAFANWCCCFGGFRYDPTLVEMNNEKKKAFSLTEHVQCWRTMNILHTFYILKIQSGAVKCGSLASLDAPELHASSDIREPIPFHQAVCLIYRRLPHRPLHR